MLKIFLRSSNNFRILKTFFKGNIDGYFEENILKPTAESRKEFIKTHTYQFTTEVLGKEHKVIEESSCNIS
jgi:hypothetical protein